MNKMIKEKVDEVFIKTLINFLNDCYFQDGLYYELDKKITNDSINAYDNEEIDLMVADNIDEVKQFLKKMLDK